MRLEWAEPALLDPAWQEGLLAEDKMFGLVDEKVLGTVLPVFNLRPRSLTEVLLVGAEQYGDRAALIGHDRTITFAEMPAHVAAVARRLAEVHGITQGDRVAFAGIPSVEHCLALWATMALGAIATTMNPAWLATELDHAIGLTEAKLLLCDDVVIERLTSTIPIEAFFDLVDGLDLVNGLDSAAGLDSVAGLEAADVALPSVDIDEDDPVAIVFTSGTTGRPKGATLSHRNAVQFCLSAAATSAVHSIVHELPGGQGSVPTVVACSPLFHVSGLLGQLTNSAFWGIRLVFAPPGRWDETVHLELSARHAVTSWSLVPTQLWRLIDHPDFARYDLSALETVGGGGAMFAPELLRRTADALPRVRLGIRVGYGMTETAGTVTMLQPPYDDAQRASVGAAVAGAQIEIRDTDGRVLPEGEIGEIFARSAQVFLGYWGDEQATDEAIGEDRWYATGDFGRIRDGLLFLESRLRDMIIRGGENIYPIEIENRLIEHPAVEEVAVIGVDHQTLGQEVKAVVVLHPGATVGPDELQDFARQTLARYKVPSIIELRTELPHNATGKVLKNLLET